MSPEANGAAESLEPQSDAGIDESEDPDPYVAAFFEEHAQRRQRPAPDPVFGSPTPFGEFGGGPQSERIEPTYAVSGRFCNERTRDRRAPGRYSS